MSGEVFQAPDSSRTRLRTLLGAMDHELATGELASLRTSLTKLVVELDLGPEPALRECPVCHHLGMRAATLCSTCWSKLTPP